MSQTKLTTVAQRKSSPWSGCRNIKIEVELARQNHFFAIADIAQCSSQLP